VAEHREQLRQQHELRAAALEATDSEWLERQSIRATIGKHLQYAIYIYILFGGLSDLIKRSLERNWKETGSFIMFYSISLVWHEYLCHPLSNFWALLPWRKRSEKAKRPTGAAQHKS